MDSEQLYYKVENKDCDLFKRANKIHRYYYSL